MKLTILLNGSSIFKNPSSLDLISLRNKRRELLEIRFMIDAKNKSVYVWDAESAIHQEVNKVLKNFIQGNYFDITQFFTGTASLEGLTLVYTHSEMIDGIIRQSKKKKANLSSKEIFIQNMGRMIINNKELLTSLYAFADYYIENVSNFFKSL